MFHPKFALLALTLLAIEPAEGADPVQQLAAGLKPAKLKPDDLATPEMAFNIGYHRGLRGATFDDTIVSGIQEGDSWKPEPKLWHVIEDAYAFGLEARDCQTPPPPGLVYAAMSSGVLKPGGFSTWHASLDLSAGWRLGTAINVGSGKTAFTVPTGTPVELITRKVIDGTRTAFVYFDGAVLRVPDPEDGPTLVPGNAVVAAQKAARKAPAKKAKKEGDASAPSTPVERGPSLRDSIITIFERFPGPLQSNGAIAAAVHADARENGVADKSATFMQKCDVHVPYYLTAYKPAKDGNAGRMNVTDPLQWVIDAVNIRSRFLDATGTFEERVVAASAGDEALAKRVLAHADTRLSFAKAPPKPKKDEAPAEVSAPAEATAEA